MFLQELERKFSQTAVYANMKKILNKKNEQIKELRKKLQHYEPDENADGLTDASLAWKLNMPTVFSKNLLIFKLSSQRH